MPVIPKQSMQILSKTHWIKAEGLHFNHTLIAIVVQRGKITKVVPLFKNKKDLIVLSLLSCGFQIQERKVGS